MPLHTTMPAIIFLQDNMGNIVEIVANIKG